MKFRPLPMFLSLMCLAMMIDPASSSSQPLPAAMPKREVRAVWIATVPGLDWPRSLDPGEQQRSLREMVVRLHDANFNTIYFQVRGRGDAMYQSRLEPWCQQLTGTLGKDPGWDPLEFIVAEAHARGLEVHAWFNTFLVRSGGGKPPVTRPAHVLLRHPEWLREVEGDWWLDPGLPAVRSYLLQVVMDLVRNYDIDGIQFDFMRYPAGIFPDDATYRRYGGRLSRDDWRRENINTFVRAVYDSVSAAKPMVKIGSTPVGVYTNFGGRKSLQAYSDLYQDSRRWLREQKEDYLVPQVYWALGDRPGNPDFASLAEDWVRNSSGRQVVIGVGAYKPQVFAELPALIDSSRAAGALGNAYFRYENIAPMLDPGGRYRHPANIPPMPWKDSTPPRPPRDVSAENLSGAVVRIRWAQPDPAPDGDSARLFDIYRSPARSIDFETGAELVAVVTGGQRAYDDTIVRPSAPRYFYAVSALDKGNNESLPAIVSAVMPEMVELSKGYAARFMLGSLYPPAPSSVVYIPYEIKDRVRVVLRIVDGQNKEVAGIVNAAQDPGSYIASADVSRLGSGTYTCILLAGDLSARRSFSVEN